MVLNTRMDVLKIQHHAVGNDGQSLIDVMG